MLSNTAESKYDEIWNFYPNYVFLPIFPGLTFKVY